MIFETDLDYDLINTLSEEDLFDYIKENFVSPNTVYPDGMSFEKSVKIMKVLCNKMLKITPSPEQWIFLLAECERLLCEACAGAGKTTMAQLRSVKEKLVFNVAGKNILALAYNNHAVDDMIYRHNDIVRRVNALNIPALRRDSTISCYTFHGFCKSWVEDYLDVFGITNKTNYLMSETDRHEAMQMAVKAHKKQRQSNLFVNDAIIDSLLSLYSFAHETLRIDIPDEWKLCPSISDLSEYSLDVIADIFSRYDRWKTIKKKMDFTDLVNNMYTICCRQDVMERIRANYQIFIVDEYQDLTPSMLRILKIILEGDESFGLGPFLNSKLTCIGDGDQSIYGFRGTDPDNCIRFKDMYESDGKLTRVTAMSENRRCPSEVLSYAKKVIESNTRRINKPVRSIKEGGKVTVNKYYNLTEEMDMLIAKLKAASPDARANSCICYRNQSSSYMLALRLVEAGIPFRLVKGHMPLTDKLSQSIFEVLNMLSYPKLLDYARKALYKVLPKSSSFTSSVIADILTAEEELRKTTEDQRTFYQLDYPNTATCINGFQDALKTLEVARNAHRYNKPMSTYVPSIVGLIRKYYLDWQNKKSSALSEEYMQYITSWFSRDISYDDFMKQYTKLTKDLSESQDDAIWLTTFHGLKGLEFDHVYIMDMNDTIFPGTELNQAKDLSSIQKDTLECEARRLFYVAMTRSKDTIDLFFDAEVPSRYIRFFTVNTGLADTYVEHMQETNGFLVADMPEEPLGIPELEGLDSLEELSDLDDLPAVDLAETSRAGVQDAMRAVASESAFTSFFAEQDAKEERLKAALGEENFSKIQGKSSVLNILDRIISEK